MAKRTGTSQIFVRGIQTGLTYIGRPFFHLLIGLVNLSLLILFVIGKITLSSTQLPRQIMGYAKSIKDDATKFTKSSIKSVQVQTSHLKLSRLQPPKINFPSLRFPHLPQIKLPKFPKLLKFLKTPKINRKRGRPRKFHFPVKAVGITLTSIVIILLFVFGLYLPILKDLPNPGTLITKPRPQTTKILARDGSTLYKIYQDQNRTQVPLSDIPDTLKYATIAIEDKDFYRHGGLSYRGILRALSRNIFNHDLQGGSTITQQLVKNALLTPERTLARKIKEVILAVMVELKFSKDEILEMYFNEVPYGGTTYGAEAAAQTYFGKKVQNLNLAEAALLAGLPAATTTYSPFGANPEMAKLRQTEVLRRMTEDGYITPEQAETAKTQSLNYAPQAQTITAPHFVMYVKDLLVKKYGEQAVLQGGLEVTTSLDPTIQTAAEQAVKNEVDKLVRLHITNGASLITNPQTGEILAMVGSQNYWDFEHDGQVNVTTRIRQPGSSIKPVNYAMALENGFTPATIIQDTPICYILPGQKPYCPKNYDGAFHGNVTLRTALGSSYNIPAVKTLSAFGVPRMIEYGKKMGITTWDDPSRFGLSLTLGGGEVKMVDMAVVYGVFANQGMRVDLHPILKITDSKDRLVEEFKCQNPLVEIHKAYAADTTTCAATRALNPLVAYQITNILSDNNARTPAFGANSLLNIPKHQVAVKTGTTQNLRDNWTIGFTKDRVIVVWVGNNDNTPMSYVASGITGASPIWRNTFDYLLQNQPDQVFTPPQDLVKVKVCTLTGTLSCEGCPSKEEYFLPGTEPKNYCSPEQIDRLRERQEEFRDRLLEGASTDR